MKFAIETFKAGEDLFKCLQATLGTGGALDELSFSAERWERVADLAAKAGLSPLLFKGLPVADPSLGIPRDVISRWFREYVQSAAWNNNLYQHLEQVLASFNREGIPVILLKGIHLMDTLYAERAMRTMGDIDILVQPEDKKRAMQAMVELNYAMHCSVEGVPINHPLHLAFAHSTSNVSVEVHFDVVDPDGPIQLDMPEYWERSQPIEINGKSARVLAPDDMIVYLCLHLASHLLSCGLFSPALRSLVDIALLIRRQSDPINWERLLQVVRHAHGEKAFSIPLVLAETLLHVPPPPVLAEHLRDALAIPSADVEMLKQHLLISCLPDAVDARLPSFVRSSIMTSKRRRVSDFFRRVIPSRAEMDRRYGPRLHWHSAFTQYFHHFHYLGRLLTNPLSLVMDRLRLAARFHYRKDKRSHTKDGAFRMDNRTLEDHFKQLASLRDRVGPCK